MTEIAIIVALVAVAAIGFLNLFGGNVTQLYGMSSAALGGKCPGTMHHYFLMAGTGAHKGHRTLKDFGYSGAGAFYSGGMCFAGP